MHSSVSDTAVSQPEVARSIVRSLFDPARRSAAISASSILC
jgi:hypothetical protein